jgi:hypothetical protein
MAELSTKRCLSTQLILYSPAMTATFVQRLEVRIIVVDFVRDAEFPFVVLAFYVFGFVAGGFGLVFFGLGGQHFGGGGEEESASGGVSRDVELINVWSCY